MKLIKSNTLYDGIAERKNLFIGFENDEITFVGSNKPKDEAEVMSHLHSLILQSHWNGKSW